MSEEDGMSEQDKLLQELATGYMGDIGQWRDGANGVWRDNSPYTQTLTAAYLNALEAENERLKKVLEWYAAEARAVKRNMENKNTTALTASMQVLALDGGARYDALKENDG